MLDDEVQRLACADRSRSSEINLDRRPPCYTPQASVLCDNGCSGWKVDLAGIHAPFGQEYRRATLTAFEMALDRSRCENGFSRITASGIACLTSVATAVM